MKSYLKYLQLSAILLSAYPSICFGQILSYQHALVRDLSDSFENSLKLNPPTVPIDISLATEQHDQYIQLLEKLVPQVTRIEADSAHPDCNFIEDTAIVAGDIAVISRMGASERRGEEEPVAQVIEKLGTKHVVRIQSPGTMDGGDILYTGKHLFVGLSHRTNKSAFHQLKEIFKDKLDVIAIPVIEGLHLKSVISLFDSETLIVAANAAGMKIQDEIQASTLDYQFICVPEPTASNVLRVGSSLIIQEGFPASGAILQKLCDQKSVIMLKLNMSELIKADGALTCGSILFD